MRVVRAGGQEEETKRRAAAVMVSRAGQDTDPPLGWGKPGMAGRHHGDVPWVRATGGPHLRLLLTMTFLFVNPNSIDALSTGDDADP